MKITKPWREIFDPAAQIFLNLTVKITRKPQRFGDKNALLLKV